MADNALRRSGRGGVSATHVIEEGYRQAEADLSQALQTAANSTSAEAAGLWGFVKAAGRKVKTKAKEVYDRYVEGGQVRAAEIIADRRENAVKDTKIGLFVLKGKMDATDSHDLSMISDVTDFRTSRVVTPPRRASNSDPEAVPADLSVRPRVFLHPLSVLETKRTGFIYSPKS